jgi:hypothetical protein
MKGDSLLQNKGTVVLISGNVNESLVNVGTYLWSYLHKVIRKIHSE